MRSFKKMAREKKVKVLTFVVFLYALNLFCDEVKAGDVPKLMQVVRDGKQGLEAVCVASEGDAYLATDWTYPVAKEDEKQPQIESYFLPNLTSEFDCNFEKDDPCVRNWKSDVWHVPKESNKNYEAIFDYRWEGFKTHIITNDTNILERRMDIQRNFNVTLSIRSDHQVEIWLCEGWLPQKHSCYAILLGAEDGKLVILKDSKNKTLSSHKNEDPIFSFEQWKSFRISLSMSGELRVVDLIKNVDLVNFRNATTLKPIYLFMNSDMPSLWKIHQNNFLYANISNETTFGPNINMSNANLCASMFVAMCEGCSITFYSERNGTKNVLFYTNGSDTNTWKRIKIFVNNYTEDRLQLFVKTEGPKDAYWMIDNVRICSPVEVKVSVLKHGNKTGFNMTDHEISCHALSMQQWRPKPFRMKFDAGSMEIAKREFNTSIELTWKQLRVYDDQLPLVLKYQGHHLCLENFALKNASLERIRSNGIILVRGDEVTLSNLVPYTHYLFTIIHPIYENLTSEFAMNTSEAENIMEYERPKNVHILSTTTSVTLVQDTPSCNDIFGPILYKYSINDNLTTTLTESTTYTYKDLKPFTNYTLKIVTVRNLSGLTNDNGKYISYYNFTTKPTVALPVSYLDIFETTKNSVSLRYKLPNATTGVPDRVYVTYCNGLMRNKCNYLVENITECVQYPGNYCIHISKLIRNERYTFKLSVKNRDTHTNGNDTDITDIAESKVPGMVSNLSYSVIDCSDYYEYCNFNVSWSHPWEQNGLTAFNIELTEVGTTKGLDDIYLIRNRDYKANYSHVIRYLPFATTYNISVRAINEQFKGNYTTIQGKIDHIGAHIDQIPDIIEVLHDSLVVEIPALDVRSDSAIITVIVQSVIIEHIDDEMWKISNGELCLDVAETWIAKVLEFSRSTTTRFIIGDGITEFSELYQRSVTNKPLLPDSEYCLTYIIQNTYKNITHTKVYHWQEKTANFLGVQEKLSSSPVQALIVAFTLMILVVIASLALYRYRHRLYCRKVRQDGDHIYEAMPFEEYNSEPNIAYNVTYDKLIHN